MNYIRFILLGSVILIGLNVGLKGIDRVDKIQQDKMQQLCQIDQSYCTTTDEPLHRSQVQEPL